MKNVIEINGRKIGPGQSVFVIAEVGINHNGDYNTAEKLIDEAKLAGADAVKLQTYVTEKRVARNSPIFGILKQCEISFDKQKKLFEYAHAIGIEIFSTPFDDESVDFLSSIDTPCFKVASFDIVNKKLIEKIASKGKPIIMSRGMANQQEIDAAMGIVKKFNINAVILHCISAYPVTSCKSLNLNTIHALEERYRCPVGFSDHTLGVESPKYAVAAGASVIEKHFTLSKRSEGPDHALSAEPKEMKAMVKGIRETSEMMGEAVWSPLLVEANAAQYRRMS